eukprot:CAMPEP_0118681908 /NCGR_PEP_ID=MMETSP0800-20121206/5198_1 /TAXON_ID=210618 ORGANISM="Striatella unipunctata, Strain CCMP2910" /NCGR_SAMPLE_ID=MMETSP0800 /ASSEMBLY_ACC=CAM_ASM_000638 /LENGTH=38 /DNA_ID= /DNA_START= /DNA_END= /DNA_ORIENTATION=
MAFITLSRPDQQPNTQNTRNSPQSVGGSKRLFIFGSIT